MCSVTELRTLGKPNRDASTICLHRKNVLLGDLGEATLEDYEPITVALLEILNNTYIY